MRMERTKSFISGMLVMGLLVALIGTAAATVRQRTANLDYADIKITLNGKAVTPIDANGNVVEPFTISGTTYLPVRGIASALGLDVTWDGATSTVGLSGNAQNSVSDIYYKGAIQNLGVYHDFTNLGDNFKILADDLQGYMDLINLGVTSSQLKTVMDKCDTEFDNINKFLGEILDMVDPYDSYDLEIVQNFVNAQDKLVEMKQAALNYRTYKDSESQKSFTLAYWAAVGESSKGVVSAENRFWIVYNSSR